jgi:hypothetical protein
MIALWRARQAWQRHAWFFLLIPCCMCYCTLHLHAALRRVSNVAHACCMCCFDVKTAQLEVAKAVACSLYFCVQGV